MGPAAADVDSADVALVPSREAAVVYLEFLNMYPWYSAGVR